MKTFVERYTEDQFNIAADIREVFLLMHMNAYSGNYQPYQVRSLDSSYQICLDINYKNKETKALLQLRSLKLDFAIQVWQFAQKETQQKYPHYLEHEWIKRNGDPIKEVIFTDKNRIEAEEYFYQMLIQGCNDPKISSSEQEVFTKSKDAYSYTKTVILDIFINKDEITDEIAEKVRKQYAENEKWYEFKVKNQRFTFEEIKNYFVYCDNKLLSLLNVEDGIKCITRAEHALFRAAENHDWNGILKALELGADINAIDDDGETALTKVFATFNMHCYYNNKKTEDEELIVERVISMAQKMLELGADINLFGYNGINALQYTAYIHHPVLMKFLLDNGANPNINYFPEDGLDFIISMPLDTILTDYYVDSDIENIEKCRMLLINAGAK